ncbi:hypothetical protein NMY22_g17081 [Coprinellus aureogranulatus]|nr:hypothetical protein NMY22_g17081 [Coprinellus aureogranulatus]
MPRVTPTAKKSYLKGYLDISFDNGPLDDLSASSFMQGSVANSPARQKHPTTIDVPSDILQSIFTFASSPGHDDPDLIDLRLSQAMITTCAQVCRAWRSAALAQKELWASLVDFQGQSVKRLRHLLKVSYPYPFNVGHRSAPVSFTGVSADPRSRNPRRLLRLLQEHQARVREFHVDWFSYNKAFVVKGQRISLSQLEMPRLEALSWTGGGPFDRALYFRMEPDGSNSPLFPLLPDLPMLRRAVLHYAYGISNPLLSRCRATLTELSLYSPIEEGHRPPAQQLADVLRGLKNLRLLSLFNAVEYSQGAAPPVTGHLGSIVLPQLAYVSFGGARPHGMDAQIALLDAIVPSGTCGLQLLLPYRFVRDELRQPLRDCVSKFSNSPVPAKKRGVRIYISLDYEGKERTCTLSNVSLHPLDTLDFEHRGSQAVFRALASVEARPLTVRSPGVVHTLYCSGPIGQDVASMEIALKGTMDTLDNLLILITASSIFPNTNHLILHHGVAEAALRELANISLESPRHNLDLPKLRKLTLVSCKCTPDSDLFQVLAIFLDVRRNAKSAIREICFTRCIVIKDELTDFGCDITIEPCTFDSSQIAQYQKYCGRHESL